MAFSGPWFFVENVTIKAEANPQERPFVGVTNLRLTPPFPNPPDPPISAASWVWASVTELTSDGQPLFGDALIIVGNVVPQDDGSISIKVTSLWPNDLPGQIKLVFWTVS